MPRPARGALGAVAALSLVWWFLRGADLAVVAGHVRHIHLGYFLAAVTLSLGGMVYRAWRWRYLVAPLQWVDLQSLTACVFMGWAVTALAPGRAGEMARPVLLGRREGISKMALFGTVVLERGLDMLAALLLLAIYLSFFSQTLASGPGARRLVTALTTGGWVMLIGLVMALCLALVGAWLPETVARRLRHGVGQLPGRVGARGWELLMSFAAGATGALVKGGGGQTTSRLRVSVAAQTVVLWLAICGVHTLLLRAFDLDLPLYAALPLVSMAVVGLAVPVPAALGSYHNTVQLGLTLLLGVPADLAAGYAIVSHAIAFLPSGTIGLVLLAREGISWSAVTSQRAAAPTSLG